MEQRRFIRSAPRIPRQLHQVRHGSESIRIRSGETEVDLRRNEARQGFRFALGGRIVVVAPKSL